MLSSGGNDDGDGDSDGSFCCVASGAAATHGESRKNKTLQVWCAGAAKCGAAVVVGWGVVEDGPRAAPRWGAR